MGFGDFLKNIGKVALDGIQEFGDKNLEYRAKWEERYSMMSDNQLKEERDRARNGDLSYCNTQERAVRLGCLSEEMRNRGLIN